MNTVALESVPTDWTPERRKEALASAVANQVRGGWHVESQNDYQAVLVQHGTKINHVLHLVLTLITFGIWAFVWAGVALFHKRTKHAVVQVDAFGNTNIQR